MIKGSFNKTNKKYIMIACYLLVSVVLLATQENRPKRTNLIKKFGVWVMYPFHRLTNTIKDGAKSTYRNISELGTLRNKNILLKKELDSFKQRESKFIEVELENKRLRNMLGFKQRYRYILLPAEVVGKSPTNWFKTILINRGSKSGAKENMVVITPEGVLGKIIEVTNMVSRVQLILDMNSSVGAMVQRTRAIGILKGISQKTCELDYITRTKDIKVGDNIITSGLGRVFPKGLTLGTVSKVEQKSTGLFQKVEVTPKVNFYNIEEVMIVKEPYFFGDSE